MEYIQQSFSVRFKYKVFFTENLFAPGNDVLQTFLRSEVTDTPKKLLFVIDQGVIDHHPRLQDQIKAALETEQSCSLSHITVIPGGEQVKNDERLFYQLVDEVDQYGIDRHSYIAAIGGGSVLDLVGYAAGVAHRGIRLIRIPTTVLAQNDSGVGVKTGINYHAKKNFLGTFTPPVAVFNDYQFLTTLPAPEWRSGISEAVKVGLIKDRTFFEWIAQHAKALASRDLRAMKHLVKRCAELHMQHISGGDPFEKGSSRPLDFGHWSAHKVEQLSGFTIRHGEAVALGIALDTAYSYITGRLSEADARAIITVLRDLGFAVAHPLMDVAGENSAILAGLNEFREHLGGKLTIMLLEGIGKGIEVHELDTPSLRKASNWINTL